jgi:hypothetical protein
MKSTLITTVFITTVLLSGAIPQARAADLPSLGDTGLKARRPLPASWKWSLAPVLASQALDASSSYGMRELNPALSGSDGRFGMQATSIKLGVTGALLGVEYLVARAHPGAAGWFTKLNWATGAVTFGFAVHNYSIR